MIHALLTQFPNLSDEAPIGYTPSNPLSDFSLPKRSGQEHLLESVSDTRTSLASSTMCFTHPDDSLIESEGSDDGTTFVEADSAVSQPLLTSDSRGSFQTPNVVAKKTDLSINSLVTSRTKCTSKHAINLSSLLRIADELYEKFPPLHSLPESAAQLTSSTSASHESSVEDGLRPSSQGSLPPACAQHVRIDDVFGPNSVIFTWSEDPSRMLSDDDAERLVGDGLQDVCNEPDGASDRDLHEAEYERDTKERKEDSRRREKRRREMIRSGVGLSIAVVVALSAIMLYAADHPPTHYTVANHADWYQKSSSMAGFIVGLGERVLGL